MAEKDVRGILRKLRKQGFEVKRTTDNHFFITNPRNGLFTTIGHNPRHIKAIVASLVKIGFDDNWVKPKVAMPCQQVLEPIEKEEEFMPRSPWTELNVIATIPSPNGDFLIKFRLMRVEETGDLLVDIRKTVTKSNGEEIFTRDGVTFSFAENIGKLDKIFHNMNEAYQQTLKETVSA